MYIYIYVLIYVRGEWRETVETTQTGRGARKLIAMRRASHCSLARRMAANLPTKGCPC